MDETRNLYNIINVDEKLNFRKNLPRTRSHYYACSLSPQEMTPAHFMEHMAVDKKVLDGRLRLVLLRQMGEAVVTDDYSKEILQATLSADYRAIVAQL